MKIHIIILAVLVMLFTMFPAVINAEDAVSEEAEHINAVLDESSGGLMSESDISVENASELITSDLKGFLSWIGENIRDEVTAPLRLFGLLFSVIIFSAVSCGTEMYGRKNGTLKTAETISVLVAVTAVTGPAGRSFDEVSTVINDGSTFMLAFVPVMSGIMAAQGNITSAGSYQLLTAGVCDIFSQVVSSVLMPCISICFSVSIVDSVVPGLCLDGFVKGMKKAVTLAAGLVMTVFTALITIQNTAGNAADTLSVKTGRYLVANLVPVVGKAVSDSYSTLRGSIGILRTGAGSTGIAVLFLMTATPVIRLFLYRFVIGTAEVFADVFGCTRLKKFFSDMSVLYGIVTAAAIVFIVMLITSTAVVMRSYTGE